MVSSDFLAAISRVPREHQQSFAEQGVRDGLWTGEDVSAFFAIPDRDTPAQQRVRKPSPPRREKLAKRPWLFSRYVRRFSTDAITDPHLSKGAVITLIHIISRCGRRRMMKGCTRWIAEDLGVSVRTVQLHYRQLEQTGFIVRSSPDARGQTTIYLTERCEVSPFKTRAAQRQTPHRKTAKKSAATNEINSEERDKPSPSRAVRAEHSAYPTDRESPLVASRSNPTCKEAECGYEEPMTTSPHREEGHRFNAHLDRVLANLGIAPGKSNRLCADGPRRKATLYGDLEGT